ncbi:N-acetylmuramic acid 6-phosphate etherase [Paenibacillus thermoaerophilus]|uniref:N-acetylmuramic acid 6-phosphate etherase n=1 Tax=Paenibacillus thermoaerophilus TaxID=1215385 RepID=A0ABW2V3A7_9BACL|nr:N-acetylmuramic acid 6-phosphate etherase [Paenibacillus thermoaerophilus]TMV17687.1 N-acetylmuramic acid 6-phosphate etherase [Paenibacillus thermoaerophilus]
MNAHEMDRLETERRDPRAPELDLMHTLDILRYMNEADRSVPDRVGEKLADIAAAVDAIVNAIRGGGRLFYVGAGTSGRLGLLDAYECPPTFGTPPELVQAVMAGGAGMLQADESAEDRAEDGAAELQARQLTARDVVVGIAASGRTPFVIGAMRYARQVGAATVAVSCVRGSAIGELADIAIEVPVGPEVVTGSTRLKAGTAQKLVLNMLSTAAMIRLGKVFGNLMVDMQPTNSKLMRRAERIVEMATGASPDTAVRTLRQTGGDVKAAIVMLLGSVRDAGRASDLLRLADGNVREALRLAASVPDEPKVRPEATRP